MISYMHMFVYAHIYLYLSAKELYTEKYFGSVDLASQHQCPMNPRVLQAQQKHVGPFRAPVMHAFSLKAQATKHEPRGALGSMWTGHFPAPDEMPNGVSASAFWHDLAELFDSTSSCEQEGAGTKSSSG